MIKIFKVDEQFSDMRIDRFIKKNIKNIPQGLIEKNLRTGKIKLNGKKIKSSHRIKKNDVLNFFNVNFYANIENKKTLYKPSKKILKREPPVPLRSTFHILQNLINMITCMVFTTF